MSQWRVLVAETGTGRIVGEVAPSQPPRFDRRITEPGSWTVDTVLGHGGNRLDDLYAWTETRRYSWAVCWGENIAQAGPTRTWQVDDEQRTLSVSGTGIAAEFERRVLRNPHGHTAITHPSEDLILQDLSVRGLVVEVVRANLAQLGYRLPIVLPEPESGPESVTYYGYDLAYVWDRLRDLSNRDNGPDIDFRPRFAGDGRHIEWVLDLGSPLLGRTDPPLTWDYGSAISSIRPDIDGAATPASRVWAKGAGSRRTLLTGVAEDPHVPAEGIPPVDIVDTSHNAERRQDVLESYARATLEAHRSAPSRWETTLRLPLPGGWPSDPTTALGWWRLGDAPLIATCGHPWLAEGHYRRRITGFSDSGPTELALDLDIVR